MVKPYILSSILVDDFRPDSKGLSLFNILRLWNSIQGEVCPKQLADFRFFLFITEIVRAAPMSSILSWALFQKCNGVT